MKALIIGEGERAKLQALKKKAEKNPFSFQDLIDIAAGAKKTAGDSGFSCNIPVGYCVAYSIEQNKDQNTGNFLMTRHLSMSASAAGKVPNKHAIGIIMEELGFKNKIDGECEVWLDDIGENQQAVNVVEIIED